MSTGTNADLYLDEVDAWHNEAGAAFNVPLHSYLGMTWTQYAHWTETGQPPPAPNGPPHP